MTLPLQRSNRKRNGQQSCLRAASRPLCQPGAICPISPIQKGSRPIRLIGSSRDSTGVGGQSHRRPGTLLSAAGLRGVAPASSSGLRTLWILTSQRSRVRPVFRCAPSVSEWHRAKTALKQVADKSRKLTLSGCSFGRALDEFAASFTTDGSPSNYRQDGYLF